jgi:phosphate transport system substrate-binding protein
MSLSGESCNIIHQWGYSYFRPTFRRQFHEIINILYAEKSELQAGHFNKQRRREGDRQINEISNGRVDSLALIKIHRGLLHMNLSRLFFIALAVLGASYITSFAAEIRVEGGAAAISNVFTPIKEAYQDATGNTLTIRLTNPTKALIALEKGEVHLASLNSLSFDDAIAKAKAQGVVIDPSKLIRQVISDGKVVIFLNKSNKVTVLTKDQLKGIFTGKITNWSEVGGDDREIRVYWGKETPYLNKLFSKTILNGEPVTVSAKEGIDHFNLRELVLKDSSAISLNTSGLEMPGIKLPEIPLMSLPLEVVTKGQPSEEVSKLLKFYREEFGYMSE